MKGRMNLPPSQRRGRDDWKDCVAKIAADILDMTRSGRPLSGATALRAHVLGQFRTALDPEIPIASLYFDGQGERGERMVAVAEAVRLVLERERFDWRSPSAAESVMVVAQRALDDAFRAERESYSNREVYELTGRPWTWRDQVERLARMFVNFHRQAHPDDEPAIIRSSVLGSFREALGDAPSGEMISEPAAPSGPAEDAQQQTYVSAAGAFRMVLALEDIDWYDPANAARGMEVVAEAVDDELAHPDPGCP